MMDDWTHDELMEILTATAVSTRYIPYKWGPKCIRELRNRARGGDYGRVMRVLLPVLKEKWRDPRRKVAQQLPEMKRIESVLPQSIQSYLVRRRTQKLLAAIGPIEGTSRTAKIHALCGQHPSDVLSGFARKRL